MLGTQPLGAMHRDKLLEATSQKYVIKQLRENRPKRVGTNINTSVNTHKYILLMYQKNVCLKRNKKVLYLLNALALMMY